MTAPLQTRAGRLARLLACALAVFGLAGGGIAGAQDKIEMRIASVVAADATVYVGTDHFAERVSELTDGEVEVTVYEGSLGKGERELYEALQLGTLEGVIATTGPLSAFVPAADLFNLPFLFKNTEHAFRAVDGEIGEWFNEKMKAKGFNTLGWWTIGTRNTSNNVRAIEEPDDYDGLKIRTMESPPFIELYKAMGAIPVPMSITEVYTALQQGTIDGIDGSLPAQLEFKHIEVLDYAAVTDHVILLFPFSVSQDWWESLPDDVRSAIRTAEAEAREIQRKADAEYNEKIEQEWEARGKTVTHPDLEPFREVAKEIYPMFYDKVGGEEVIRRVEELGEGL